MTQRPSRRLPRRPFAAVAILVAASGLALPWPALGQQRTVLDLPAWAQVKQQTPRKALIIGVSRYAHLDPLPYAERDAAAVETQLGQLGFQVRRPTTNFDRDSLLQAVDDFLAGLVEGDIALIYFSGHGAERGGANYLIPADVRTLEPGREGLIAINTEFLLAELEKRKSSVAIVILDACRDDPFPSNGNAPILTGPKGLAPMIADPTGMFIGFAAAPRTSSFSGLSNDPPDAPSIFTRYLIDALPKEGKSLFWVWSQVGNKVFDVTQQKQRPWFHASLFPELKLKAAAADISEAEHAWVQAIDTSSDLTLQRDLEAYLEAFPDSPFAPAARSKLRALRLSPSFASDQSLPSGNEEIARLAMETRTLSGSVSSTSYMSTQADANLLVASSDLIVRERPSTDAPAVTSVRAGSGLMAMALPNTAGWLPVRVANGASGYISSVSSTALVQRSATRISFATGKSAPTQSDLARLAPIAADAKLNGGQVRIDLGTGSDVLPDRALTNAYLRGLAIRSALVRDGLRPEQIQLRLNRRNLGQSGDAAVTLSR